MPDSGDVDLDAALRLFTDKESEHPNESGAICAIASTRHLIQTMRNALDHRDKATKKREEGEERKSANEVEAAKRDSDDALEEEVKWLRERWR